MIVREMVRRCNYDVTQVLKVSMALENQEEQEVDFEDADTQMVEILWDHYLNTGYLSARILDHLNAINACLVEAEVIWELIESLPEKPFELITVHDCFRCLPNYGNDLRMQYNRQLYLISKSNLLSSILSQLLEREVSIGKLDNTLHLDILSTEYSLS